MNKTTHELLHELKQRSSLQDFITENHDAFYSLEFKEYLNELLCQKGLSKAEAISRAGLHQTYAYQIFSGKKNPSRNKVLALCFGMGLTIEETQRTVTLAGVGALYPKVQRDSVILFALEKGFSLITCNELLFDLQEEMLA